MKIADIEQLPEKDEYDKFVKEICKNLLRRKRSVPNSLEFIKLFKQLSEEFYRTSLPKSSPNKWRLALDYSGCRVYLDGEMEGEKK